MATKQARGTKRTCQNDECGARFYDLNNSPIVCPVCGSEYEIASSPAALAALQAEERAARNKARKAEPVADLTEAPDTEIDSEDALAEAAGDDEAVADEGDATFLEEEEEDGGEGSNIIRGPVEGDEEA